MRFSRSAILVPLTLLGVELPACTSETSAPAPEPTAATSEQLLGGLSESCTTPEASFVSKAWMTGRFVSQTDAFKKCMSTWPYVPCSQDDNKDPAALLPVTRSTNDVLIECANLGTPDPNQGLVQGETQGSDCHDYGYSGQEVFTVNSWWLDEILASSSSPTHTELVDLAGVIWHEAMHVHGYHHGSGGADAAAQQCGRSSSTWAWNFNSAPYIVSNCFQQLDTTDWVENEFLSIGAVPTQAQKDALWASIEGNPSYSPQDLWNDVHTIGLPGSIAGNTSDAYGPHPVYRIYVPASEDLELRLNGLPSSSSNVSIQVTSLLPLGGSQAYGTSVLTGVDPATNTGWYQAVAPGLAPGWYFVAVRGNADAYTLVATPYAPPPPTNCRAASYCVDSNSIICDPLWAGDPQSMQMLLERSVDGDATWQVVQSEPASPGMPVAMDDGNQPNVPQADYRVCLTYQSAVSCTAPVPLTYSGMPCQTGYGGGGAGSSSGGASGCRTRHCLE